MKKKRKADGWALRGPRGNLFPKTFAVTRDDAWGFSYNEVLVRKKWMEPFWKLWDASIREAAEHGYVLVRVSLQVEEEDQ